VFKFPLQRILDLRAKREQEIATQLAQAQQDADAAREAHAALEAVRSAEIDKLVAAHAAERTVGQLQNLSYVLERLDSAVAEASGKVSAAEAVVQKVQDALTAAVQERRVLDRLRERQHDAWKMEEAQLDRRLMDSIALSQFHRSADTKSSKQDK
jgi:flagellar FliJ protein